MKNSDPWEMAYREKEPQMFRPRQREKEPARAWQPSCVEEILWEVKVNQVHRAEYQRGESCTQREFRDL